MGEGSAFALECEANAAIPGFVTSAWHITSRAAFTACCIGVLCLAISFEALGRLSQKYDRQILRQFQYAPIPSTDDEESHPTTENFSNVVGEYATTVEVRLKGNNLRRFPSPGTYLNTGGNSRPSLFQQGIRAGIHMVRFGMAYFTMLLAMSLNGYLVFVVLIGTYMGSFVFSWESGATR